MPGRPEPPGPRHRLAGPLHQERRSGDRARGPLEQPPRVVELRAGSRLHGGHQDRLPAGRPALLGRDLGLPPAQRRPRRGVLLRRRLARRHDEQRHGPVVRPRPDHRGRHGLPHPGARRDRQLCLRRPHLRLLAARRVLGHLLAAVHRRRLHDHGRRHEPADHAPDHPAHDAPDHACDDSAHHPADLRRRRLQRGRTRHQLLVGRFPGRRDGAQHRHPADHRLGRRAGPAVGRDDQQRLERRRRHVGTGHHAAQRRLQRHARPVGKYLLGHDAQRLRPEPRHPDVYGIGVTPRGTV
ncbi:hypothetical protein SCOCK_430013 [Actinacidiphila cocklensis]|uniref:Uncharacterized protein n=1 Tax=Actinacidiphila cocklensis TaxID=887465 RepID=A0A9W4DVB2_9ACTN|nr:hypothetical protein SCOCK_430013 [Actinacidiphila cocklensis]